MTTRTEEAFRSDGRRTGRRSGNSVGRAGWNSKTMETELISVEGLDHQVSRLAASEAPSEVFRALLEGARVAPPRAAIFLVRRGQIKGWGCGGYHPHARQPQREIVRRSCRACFQAVPVNIIFMPIALG